MQEEKETGELGVAKVRNTIRSPDSSYWQHHERRYVYIFKRSMIDVQIHHLPTAATSH